MSVHIFLLIFRAIGRGKAVLLDWLSLCGMSKRGLEVDNLEIHHILTLLAIHVFLKLFWFLPRIVDFMDCNPEFLGQSMQYIV